MVSTCVGLGSVFCGILGAIGWLRGISNKLEVFVREGCSDWEKTAIRKAGKPR
jgi:hypothetical protein